MQELYAPADQTQIDRRVKRLTAAAAGPPPVINRRSTSLVAASPPHSPVASTSGENHDAQPQWLKIKPIRVSIETSLWEELDRSELFAPGALHLFLRTQS